MKYRRTLSRRRLAAFAAGITLSALACSEPAVPAKLVLCIACHGEDGIGRDPTWPNLAAQKKAYLVKQLMGFRDGTISSPTMLPLVVELTDDDIEELADYYSNLDCCR